MKRREFITLLGGVAAAWPLAARAEQSAMPVVGFLNTASPEPFAHLIAAFSLGLNEAGFVEGSNLEIEYRWGAGDAENMRKHAVELAALAPDVILAHSSAAVAPLLQATRTIPIVFALVADPVGAGFVKSLARPGGNVTGITNFEFAASAACLLV